LPGPKKYGADAQSPLPTDKTRKLTDAEIKQVQKIVGSILYYARAVNLTVLMALSTIASEQTKGMEKHWKRRTKSWINVNVIIINYPDLYTGSQKHGQWNYPKLAKRGTL
jgi:hypothetical protein